MAEIRPNLRLALAAALLAAAPLSAQQARAPRPDPANLTGEHVAPQALADTLPINHGAPALQQLLLKLRTRASMLMIVAHPDDEDGGFLTFASRGHGARVASLTLNRGEGGQNLMSADFNDALGLIRTQELLAADRYMGVDQFFGTEVDFGFSKTKEESFEKWTHQRVLYDAVRVVRLYRPLVLASVFVGGVTDGHGQHQVSGEITQEVFLAAADPKVFPEMGLPAWAPLKVYARTPFFRVSKEGMYDYATGKYAPPVFHNYVTGADINHEPAATVTIQEGQKSTAAGMDGDTYVQFARRGLALQRSQIGANARLAPAGAFDVGYTLMASRVGCTPPPESARAFCPPQTNPASEQSVFDGIDISLPSIADLAPSGPENLRPDLESIDAKIAEAQTSLRPAHPETAAPPLREALKTLDALIDAVDSSATTAAQKFNALHELRIKRRQLNDALVLAHGITLQANLIAPTLLAGTRSVQVHATLTRTGSEPLKLVSDGIASPLHGVDRLMSREGGPREDAPLVAGTAIDSTFRLQLDRDLPPTKPYFSRPNIEQPFYNIADPTLRNAPATPSPVTARASIDDQGVLLEVQAPIADARSAEFKRAAVAVPAVSVAMMPSSGIVPLAAPTTTLTVRVTSLAPGSGGPSYTLYTAKDGPVQPAEGTLHLEMPHGWQADPPTVPWKLAKAGDQDAFSFTLTPAALKPNAPENVLAISTLGKLETPPKFSEGFRSVGYPGLAYTNFYTPATYKATAVDVVTAPDLRVAYLAGTGDAVPEFLPSLGVTPTILTLKDLNAATLANFDDLILGVRAYAAHPELAGKGSQPLLDFAKAGGVVIVQYNNAHFGPDSAPYPITAPESSGDHAHDVVDEAQPVAILEPAAPLLTWPNKITTADFSHWVEERGHGFAGTWAPEYTALLETHDPGQDPQKGGLLVAPVGKGAYIYCGLALYRQLPQGVPGAYRLVANLLSYAKNPKR